LPARVLEGPPGPHLVDGTAPAALFPAPGRIMSSRHAGLQYPRPRRSSSGKELAHGSQELIEAIVVKPVAGAVDAEDPGVAERVRASILGRVPEPALRAVQDQRGTGDPRPQALDVLAAHVVGRPHAQV